jgi:hypothetical protein
MENKAIEAIEDEIDAFEDVEHMKSRYKSSKTKK